MWPALKFRHRIGLLVGLAATALIAVAAVTYVLGQHDEAALTGIETRYVPLIELDRDLKSTFSKLTHALEDAASAAEDAKLAEADALERQLLARIEGSAQVLAGNGADPRALAGELRRYYGAAREVSAALIAGASAAQLAPKIEAMRSAQLAFATQLDTAAAPDRAQMTEAFAAARRTHTTSLRIDVGVATTALVLMGLLSWWIARRTVRSLQEVAAGVERFASGDFARKIEVPSGDELGDLAREANQTAERLRAYREASEREDWIKTGLAALTDQTVGEQQLAAVAGKALRYLATYMQARAAFVFTHDDADQLVVDRTGAADVTPTVEALDTRDVRTTGNTVVIPLVHEARVVGALELVLDAPPSGRVLELAARVRSLLGTTFHVAQSGERERQLLFETQRQAAAAQAANKELEAFSYSVSHDLRGPLRGIDGFSQALLEDCSDVLPAQGQDYLRRIRAAAQRMAELIDDLLRLSRVTRAEFRRQQVDISAIAAGVVDELRRSQPDRAVEVRVQSGVIAGADPQLLKITFENLLGNAWKFTSKTNAPVIEFGESDEDGERVFFVRDNGAGFDMKYVDKLFGAFQRLHTDKQFPGTGIGLATVQRIIHRHGGRIWVEAALDQGATFHFTLDAERTKEIPKL